ncbi:MAG: esterase-like activity of phytase family protein [Prevotellaceae bacterium]|jgi:hypothetical protein|nr:esterase-like activity of phytase family protein [Prevotellaceae bacterium]
MKKILLLSFVCVSLVCCGIISKNSDNSTFHSAIVQSEKVTVPESQTPVYLGGYGSSMAYCAADSAFYLLTDRGPNVEGATPESKVFALPDFVPHIGKFRLQNGEWVLMEKIEFKEPGGTPFSGIPNAEGNGSTNETAYNLRGEVIGNSGRRGIDPEGLAVAPDGTFWISDEYAPYVLHFDKNGFLLETLSPFNGSLPAYYATRRPNRGMEGLTISRDGKTLTGIMQSPLAGAENPLQVRIISIDLRTKKVSEYFYPLSDATTMVSEILFVKENEFLVLERDGSFPKNGNGFKKIFKINTATTDNNGVLEKELYLDILAAIPDYPHDKPEGIAFVNNGKMIGIVNDDDFGINAPEKPDGTLVPKLTANALPDRNVLYFVKIK